MTVRVRNGVSFRRNKKKKKLKKETRWIKEETDIGKWCVMLAGGCLKRNKEKVSTADNWSGVLTCLTYNTF